MVEDSQETPEQKIARLTERHHIAKARAEAARARLKEWDKAKQIDLHNGNDHARMALMKKHKKEDGTWDQRSSIGLKVFAALTILLIVGGLILISRNGNATQSAIANATLLAITIGAIWGAAT